VNPRTAWLSVRHDQQNGAPTMTWLKRLPGFKRAPAGLEWVVLRRLPWIALVGTALPALAMLAASLLLGGAGADAADAKLATTLQIMLISLLVFHWTAVFTAALLCLIVWIAKGPAFVADAYDLPDADRPGVPRTARNAN
jgi:hypothetical protein